MDTTDDEWLVVSRRGHEWLVRADGQKELERRELSDVEAWSTDGSHAVCASYIQLKPYDDFWILRLAGERTFDIGRIGPEHVSFTAVGPRRFVRASESGVYRYDLDKHGVTEVRVASEGGTSVVGARDDETVGLTRDGEAWVLNVMSEEARSLGPGRCLALDAEARYALVERGENIVFVDAGTEHMIGPVSGVTRSAKDWVGADIGGPRFSPQGHVLATLKRADGSRSVGRWVRRSKRWSVLARGPLCDVHSDSGDIVFQRDGQLWVADRQGRHVRSLGEGSFARWKLPNEPQRKWSKKKHGDRPSEAPTVQVVAPPARVDDVSEIHMALTKPVVQLPAAKKPAAKKPAAKKPAAKKPVAKKPAATEKPRPSTSPHLFCRVWDEPTWPEPPSTVPDAEPTAAAIGALRGQIESLDAVLSEWDGQLEDDLLGDPDQLDALRHRVRTLKTKLLETPQRILGVVASDKPAPESVTAAQVLILRYDDPAAQWVIKNGPLGPAIEWATRTSASWLPPLADDLVARSPGSLRRLWPHLTRTDALARLVRKRLGQPTLDAEERRWVWDRYFELRPRDAVLWAQKNKNHSLRLFEAQKLALAGDASDPDALALVIHSSVPEARFRAYGLLHGVDAERAWGYARDTLSASVERWQSSATAWAVRQADVGAARYFFEAIRLWPHRFINAFSAWEKNIGDAVEGVVAALAPNEQACIAILRGDEAAFLEWSRSEPEESDRELPLIVAFAHPDESLAGRVVGALGEGTPRAWMIGPLVRASKRVSIDDVAALARSHPDVARRALDSLVAPEVAKSEQIRGLKLLFLLGGENASQARLLGGMHSDGYVRSLIAGFIAERG